MRKITAIWLCIIGLFVPSSAEADWQSFTYTNGTYAAFSMTLPTRDERHALLTIDFNARRNCTTYVGLNVYTGSRLGRPVSNEQARPNSLYVQTGRLRWTGGKDKVIYTNGFEVMMAIGEDFIKAIKRRGIVSARVGSGPIYEFPSGSNFGAIEVARRACWAMR
jgi:hypothetical protein